MADRPPNTGQQASDEQTAADFIQRAKILIVREQYHDAVRECRLGLLAHPSYVQGRLVLGTALLALGRHDEVLAEMRAALEHQPNNAAAHLLKGQALYFKRDFRQARQELEKAHRIDPDNAQAAYMVEQVRGAVGFAGGGPGRTADGAFEIDMSQEDPEAEMRSESTRIDGESPDFGLDEPSGVSDDERYSTAPWLPPSYLEQMRRRAAEEQRAGRLKTGEYSTDDETEADPSGADSLLASGLLFPQSTGEITVDEGSIVAPSPESEDVALDDLVRSLSQQQPAEASGHSGDSDTGEVSLDSLRRAVAEDTEDEEATESIDAAVSPADPYAPQSVPPLAAPPPEREESVPGLFAAAMSDEVDEEPTFQVDVASLSDDDPQPVADVSLDDLSDGVPGFDGVEVGDQSTEAWGDPPLHEPDTPAPPEDVRRTTPASSPPQSAEPLSSIPSLDPGPPVAEYVEDDSTMSEQSRGLFLPSETGAADWDNADADQVEDEEPTTASVMGESTGLEVPQSGDWGEEVPEEPTGALGRGQDNKPEGWDQGYAGSGGDPSWPKDETGAELGRTPWDAGDESGVVLDEAASVNWDAGPVAAVENVDEEPTAATGLDSGLLSSWRDSATNEAPSVSGWERPSTAQVSVPDEPESDTLGLINDALDGADEEPTGLAVPGPELSDPAMDVEAGPPADGGSPWGTLPVPRVPTESTRSIDLDEAVAEVASHPPLSPDASEVAVGGSVPDISQVQAVDGSVPDISQVQALPDEDVVDSGLIPLESIPSAELSELSLETDLSELSLEVDAPPQVPGAPSLPPLPPTAADGMDSAWSGPGGPPVGGQPPSLPPLPAGMGLADPPAASPEMFDDPFEAVPDDDEVEYEEATMVRFDLNADLLDGQAGQPAPKPPLSPPPMVPARPSAAPPMPPVADVPAYAAPATPRPAPQAEPPPWSPESTVDLDGDEAPVPPSVAPPSVAPPSVAPPSVAPPPEPPRSVADQPGSPSAAPFAGSAALPPSGRPRGVPERTSTGLMEMIRGKPGSRRLWLLVVGTVCVVLAAVGVGFAVRYVRLDDQIEAKWTKVQSSLTSGNYSDFIAAARGCVEILKRRPEDTVARWAHVRISAAIPVEFGVATPQAQQPTGTEKSPSVDRLAADIYAAMFSGSRDKAASALKAAAGARAKSGLLVYLAGRVALLSGDPAKARKELDTAVKAVPGDALVLRWQGEAALLQGKLADADAAFSAALKGNPNHVGALLGRAKLALAGRKDLTRAETDLRSLLSGERKDHASAGERGWAHLLLARLHQRRGELPHSRDQLIRAKKSQPVRDAAFLDELSLALLESRQYTEARQVARNAQRTFAGRPWPHIRLARISLESGQASDALKALKPALTLKSPEVHLLHARVLLAMGKGYEARREADAALALAPASVEVQLIKARILAAAGEPAQAELLLRNARNKHPRNAKLLVALGQVLLAQSKNADARRVLNDALNVDAKAVSAHIMLAKVLLAEGRFGEAVKRLEEVTRSGAGHVDALAMLADLQLGLGERTKARATWQTLIGRAPDEPRARLGMAEVLTVLHEYRLAEVEIKAAASQVVDKSGLAVAQGRLLLAQGKAHEAASHAQNAVSAAAKNADAWDLLVRSYLMDSDESAARRAASDMAQKLPSTPETLVSAGRVELFAGQCQRAGRTFSRAVGLLQKSPRPAARAAEILVLLGRSHHDCGNLAGALGQYEEAVRLCPLCPEPPYRWGLALEENGRGQDAIAKLRRALTLDSKMVEVYYDLGQMLEREGNNAEAIKAYEKYLKLNPPAELAEAAREALQALR